MVLSKKLKFDRMEKWYVHKQESVLEKNARNSLGFSDTNGSPNLGQTTIVLIVKKKKKKCRIVKFAVLADLSKIKQKRKEWLIPRSWHRTTKVMKHENDDDTSCNLCTRNNLQMFRLKKLSRLAKILRRVQENWRDLLSLRLQWETIGKRWCEKHEKE